MNKFIIIIFIVLFFTFYFNKDNEEFNNYTNHLVPTQLEVCAGREGKTCMYDNLICMDNKCIDKDNFDKLEGVNQINLIDNPNVLKIGDDSMEDITGEDLQDLLKEQVLTQANTNDLMSSRKGDEIYNFLTSSNSNPKAN